jgi:transcriptional regulator with XRE-family HTH domain
MDQLKRLRTEKGLSQAKLAALADVDPSTVNQIERGAREASPATLRKLAEALDVSIAELIEDTTPKALAPPSLLNNLAEERRTEWDAAVRNARQLREGGFPRMEELLAAWRKSLERGEDADARQGLRAAMGELLQEALNARSVLQKYASVPATDNIPLDRIPIPEFEEIAEAHRFYDALVDMVLGARLAIRRERKPDREVHEVEEAA